MCKMVSNEKLNKTKNYMKFKTKNHHKVKKKKTKRISHRIIKKTVPNRIRQLLITAKIILKKRE